MQRLEDINFKLTKGKEFQTDRISEKQTVVKTQNLISHLKKEQAFKLFGVIQEEAQSSQIVKAFVIEARKEKQTKDIKKKAKARAEPEIEKQFKAK